MPLFVSFPSLAAIRAEIRALFTLALPLAIGELGGVAMHLTDTAMLGRVGVTEVAAAGIADSVFLVITLLGIGILIMTTPLAAAADEAGDGSELKNLLLGGAVWSVLLAAVLAVPLYYVAGHFALLSQPPDVEAEARRYLLITIPQILPFLLMIHLVHFTDGLSLTRVGMILSLAGMVVNGCLNWVFMYGHWGVPPLGIIGAGISTFVTQTLVCVGMVIYVFRSKPLAWIRAVPTTAVAVWANMRRYIVVAVPVGLQIVVEYAAWAVGMMWAGWLGKVPLAAHQVAVQLATATFMVILAIGSSGGIRIGQAVGAAESGEVEGIAERMRTTGIGAILLAYSVVALPACSFLLMPFAWASFFLPDPSAAAVAAPLIIIAGAFQLLDSTQYVSVALLRGRGDTGLPSAISLLAYWLLGMPMGYYLAFVAGWGIRGVWAGFLVALAVQSVFFSWRFFRGVRGLE